MRLSPRAQSVCEVCNVDCQHLICWGRANISYTTKLSIGILCSNTFLPNTTRKCIKGNACIYRKGCIRGQSLPCSGICIIIIQAGSGCIERRKVPLLLGICLCLDCANLENICHKVNISCRTKSSSKQSIT